MEVGHKGLTKLHVVRSMHERKALMADLSDAFVALSDELIRHPNGQNEEGSFLIHWSAV